MFLQDFRRNIIDPAVAFWICVGQEDDAEVCEMLRRKETEGKESLLVFDEKGTTEFILGYAIWTFHGMGPPAPATAIKKLFNSIERTLLKFKDIYTTHFLPLPPLFNQPLRLAFDSLLQPLPAHITLHPAGQPRPRAMGATARRRLAADGVGAQRGEGA
jgi:hypothetical protein